MSASENTIVESEDSKIDQFLDRERKIDKKENWTRLDRTTKLVKLREYAVRYVAEHKLEEGADDTLMAYLEGCLNRRRFRCNKDVEYDKENGRIISLPALLYNKCSNRFTLKRAEGRASTTSSLGPTRRRREKKIENEPKDV
tara:strand:- start:85 stop:510 length:426 start_codon:yes stop_codon:yes gene_type:complete